MATPFPLSPREFHWLWYFAVVAGERSLRRAAERLSMSEPPLSRQIRALEDRLGVALFQRHSRGLVLTAQGERVLEAVRPLLALQERVFEDLAQLAAGAAPGALGLTTAVEQGVFAALEADLRGGPGCPRFLRAPSPRLVREVLRGRLDAAVVALPQELPSLPAGLALTPLAHEEPLLAVLPEAWPVCRALGAGGRLRLVQCDGAPLFWFRREQNPAWFDHVQAVFRHLGCAPRLLEEAPEHDVLLARIARGEAMGLLPASFAAIGREGVRYAPLEEAPLLRLRLGLLVREGGAGRLALREAVRRHLGAPRCGG